MQATRATFFSLPLAMPHKHNDIRRHKIKKSRYKVTNWHGYNNGLRQRGDFTIWFTEEAIVQSA